jgi:hypothetical protein
MLAQVTSCAVVGLDDALVDVEVDVSNGQPGFTKAVPETQWKCPEQRWVFGKIGGRVRRI